MGTLRPDQAAANSNVCFTVYHSMHKMATRNGVQSDLCRNIVMFYTSILSVPKRRKSKFPP